MGEPWGIPTKKLAGVLGDPWKTKVQVLSVRKEEIQSSMLNGALSWRSIDLSLTASRLSKPAFVSRNRVETFHRGSWRV